MPLVGAKTLILFHKISFFNYSQLKLLDIDFSKKKNIFINRIKHL